jgi:protein-tyrosine phosphatase
MGSSQAETHVDRRKRVLEFEGGCNFRDIGGYATSDGRSVRWGQVYRAGVLTYFSVRDHAPLKDLKVRALCDLRRVEEREREPSRWPDSTVASLSFGDGTGAPTIRGFAAHRSEDAAGMRAAMIDVYRALPVWMGPRLAGMFECIEAGNLSLVVHCAAGKDRTGVAIAVLLAALGVPRDTILEDYLLTNEAGDFERFIRNRHDAELGLADRHHPLLSLPADVRRVLFAADADYLMTSFDEIDRQFGDVPGYLERVVGLNRSRLGQIRDLLLA